MGTICTSGAALFKAGKNVYTGFTEAQYDMAISQAESLVNVSSREDWSGAYAALAPEVKFLVQEACSNFAAMYLIQYDMSGYTSRSEAETMLDVLRDAGLRALSLLRIQNQQTFMESL